MSETKTFKKKREGLLLPSVLAGQFQMLYRAWLPSGFSFSCPRRWPSPKPWCAGAFFHFRAEYTLPWKHFFHDGEQPILCLSPLSQGRGDQAFKFSCLVPSPAPSRLLQPPQPGTDSPAPVSTVPVCTAYPGIWMSTSPCASHFSVEHSTCLSEDNNLTKILQQIKALTIMLQMSTCVCVHPRAQGRWGDLNPPVVLQCQPMATHWGVKQQQQQLARLTRGLS